MATPHGPEAPSANELTAAGAQSEVLSYRTRPYRPWTSRVKLVPLVLTAFLVCAGIPALALSRRTAFTVADQQFDVLGLGLILLALAIGNFLLPW